MSSRTPELLERLFKSKPVVLLEDLQNALLNASRVTTFRYLKRVPYLRSYNHNGRYYAGRASARFDRFGLYTYEGIHFSRDGNLGVTVQRLVQESEAGWTQRELQSLLRVRVQGLLLDAVRHKTIRREKPVGFYLYLHGDPKVGEAQLQRRLDTIALRESVDAEQVDDAIVIEVLLTLLRHPGSRPEEVVRHLRGHAPPIAMAQIVVIFTRYDLEEIGEKGGLANS